VFGGVTISVKGFLCSCDVEPRFGQISATTFMEPQMEGKVKVNQGGLEQNKRNYEDVCLLRCCAV
jgi:hypothetical protein